MISNIIKKWKQKNVVMDKILEKLSDPSNWVHDNDNNYKCINSDLSINWGCDHSWGDSEKMRYISTPVYIGIPLRYRKRFSKYIAQIGNRKASNNLEFLNQYLDGEYIMSIQIKSNQRKAISLWLEEQKIYDWYEVNSRIWFKNEEDIMAYKLKWE